MVLMDRNYNVFNQANYCDFDAMRNDEVFEVDEMIAPIISILNKKGYLTSYSCSGHPYGMKSSESHIFDSKFTGEEDVDEEIGTYMNITNSKKVCVDGNYVKIYIGVTYGFDAYIMFKPEIELDVSLPDGWEYDRDLNGVCIRYHYDFENGSYFSKYDKILKTMRSLFGWALDLPEYKINSKKESSSSNTKSVEKKKYTVVLYSNFDEKYNLREGYDTIDEANYAAKKYYQYIREYISDNKTFLIMRDECESYGDLFKFVISGIDKQNSWKEFKCFIDYDSIANNQSN